MEVRTVPITLTFPSILRPPYYIAPAEGEGSYGETYTALDTVTYLPAEFEVHTPYAKFTEKFTEYVEGDKTHKLYIAGAITFDVIYDDLDGKKHRIAQQESLGTTNSATTKTLSYYFNKSMPAGHYTLKLYGELDGDKIQGEYWLTVLPKEMNKTLVNDLQTAIRGGAGGNAFLQGAGIHVNVNTQIAAFNTVLTETKAANEGYWGTTAAAEHFATEVTILYNRDTWSASTYVSYDGLVDMLNAAGEYNLYYSISAKNYVTVGGENDANRTDYGFKTTLSIGIKVSDIYNSIINKSDPYFKDVTFNEGDAKTSVPQSSYYGYAFNDEEYVNVGTHTVTLTLSGNNTSWDTALPEGVSFDDYFKLGGVNNKSLTVNFEITPADNGWNVTPQMPSWSFNGFDKDNNTITAGLKFDSTVKYALIPTTATIPESWGIENGGNKVSGAKDGIVYFTVDENGVVDDTTAALLNSLKPASYYLKFFVSEVTVSVTENGTAKQIKNVNSYDDIARNTAGNPIASVTVGKATNNWTSTPNVSRWTFGEYDPEVHTITAEALYPALLPKDAEGNDISGFTYTNGGDALPTVSFVVYDGERVVSDLSTLHAGTYELATSMGGSDYYTPITETRMSFTVGQATNIWSKTPQVVQWTWGNYSADRNIISAAAKFTGGDGSANSTDEPILFTVLQVINDIHVAVTGLEDFEVDGNGKIKDSNAAAAFAALNAGSYYLRAEKLGNGDYTDITGSDSTDIPFTVLEASNSWDKQPAITGFAYKQFSVANNFIAGVPHYQNADKKVYYVIGTSAFASVETLAAFQGYQTAENKYFDLTNAAAPDSTVTNYMNGLGNGTYYFAVFVPANTNNNYSHLFYTSSFGVSKTGNNWKDGDSPDISGWTYGEFAESLVKSGTSEYGTVTYTVADADGNTVKLGEEEELLSGLSFAELKDKLDDLNAGTYELRAASDYNSDYDAVTWNKAFVVAMADNEWVSGRGPSISGWVYDVNAKPAPDNGTVRYENASVSGEYFLTNADGELVGSKLNVNSEYVFNADSYAYVLTVADTTNYYGFKTKLFFTVAQADNDWNIKPADVTVTWTYNADNNPEIVFEALHNNDRLEITVGGNEIVAGSNKTIIEVLNEALANTNNYGVGSYSIVASVPAYGNYAAIDALTITLVIGQAQDSLGTFNIPGWEWDDVSQKTGTWQTSWNTDLTVPVPAVNNTVTASVYKGAAEELAVTLHYEVNDGVKQVQENDLNALKTRLLGLHVGNYTIEFVVADSANYEGCKVNTTFEVTKVDNVWEANGDPDIAGWQYGGSVANPTATPMFGKGTVVFKYAKAGDNPDDDDMSTLTWQDGTDTAGGAYWLRAYVPGTADYGELVGYKFFSINAGQNSWVNNPGVIAWNWNGYNKTVNLFSGSARNNGTATFKIYAVNGTNVRNLAASDFVFNGEKKYITEEITDSVVRKQFTTDGFRLTLNVDNVMVVSDKVAEYLNALKPGSYSLRVDIAASGDYDSLDGNAPFTVGKAANSWATGKAPAVSSYTFNNFNSNTSFTYGETVYGDKGAVRYRLTGTTYGEVEKDFGTDGKADYLTVQGWLADLPAGNYTLSAWVSAASNGTYAELYSEDSPYTTRSFTVMRATNGWTNELVTSVNKPYSEIQDEDFDEEAFAALYTPPTPRDGSVKFALLNADYTSRADTLSYSELFDKIKLLPSGEYVIRATVAQTDDYTSIGATYTRLTISSHENSFIDLPDSLTAQWEFGGVDEDKNIINNTVLGEFEVRAEYGADTVTYTLNKNTYESYSDFEDAVSELNAGSYNVTIAIAATNEYAGLSEVRMLTVSPADNSWKDGWSIGNSVTSDDSAQAGNSWAWKSTVSWEKAVPLYGTTVHVEIRKPDSSSVLRYITLQYITIDYGVTDGDSAVKTINEAISGLDAGNYELIVSAPATNNWGALSDNTAFSINKVENGWKTNPYIQGAVENKWAHGGTVVPGAEAKYGAETLRFEYETKEGDKLDSLPTESGEYVIRFIVDETDNYGEIIGELTVTIEKATNRNFSTALGVESWTWGEYDRAINVFRGTPEITDLENATVKFSVGIGTDENFAALPDLQEITLNTVGLIEKDSKAEAALRALTGGTSGENNRTTYTLRIHVGETDNYKGFVQDFTFTVAGATNRWTRGPEIITWVVSYWTEESLPRAEALYGAPEITVTGEADGTVYYKGAYVENEDGQLELVTEFNNLNRAPEGYYVLSASVAAESGHYNSILTGTFRFRINVKGAGKANYWDEMPNISGWVANIEGLYNLPAGKPVRGLPNFVFYVRNPDGTRGQKVDASLTDVVLEKGDKYEADIYIPLEYGDYILVASSNGIPTEDGKSDALTEYEIRVTIDPRPLAFEEELRISTLLYLGDRENWVAPTAKATVEDAEYDFVYTNKATGEERHEKPTKSGTYTVTVTVSADYAIDISMSVEFTVELSPNSWVAAPNIKDWSEEFSPNEPTGTASVGSDQIVYTYINVKEPDTILKEIPTTEGTYIMYADVDVAGYEPLHAEYYFTIEPAFDNDLLLVDIILALVACIATIVVICLAVKRYKWNYRK